jgi:hypothetical protein
LTPAANSYRPLQYRLFNDSTYAREVRFLHMYPACGS